ncbi:hypothetical protein INT47_002865 [Mucor saturninus]|uniref:Uncharacterized protein n=1 Tax=Mucor saturninus TaxID=64648 RepID=A0A8H7UQU3_9FUNG|nr:hypothetical protein INT47_002865 [Mucor saturninus]
MSQQSTEANNSGYSSSNSNKDNNINSNNSSNNDSNINFIQDSKLTGLKSIEKRGEWSESRKLAAVKASISHRPFDKKKKQCNSSMGFSSPRRQQSRPSFEVSWKTAKDISAARRRRGDVCIEDDNNTMERPTQQKHFDRKRAVEEARKNEYAFALAESEKQIQY